MWKILLLLIITALVVWQLEFIKTIIAWQVGVEYEPKTEASLNQELSIDSIKNVFSGLEQGVPVSNRAEYNKEDSQESYENFLLDEALDNEDDTSVASTTNTLSSSPSKIDKSMNYEDMLMVEADEEEIKKESKLQTQPAQNIQNTENEKCSTDSLLRGNLGKLLASAKDAMDKDSFISTATKPQAVTTIRATNNGLPIAKTIGFNEEPIKIERRYISEHNPVESKQLLTDLIATAGCDADSNSNRYVTNLLKEVTHSKVKVMKVEAEYTTIRVRSGDSLSKLASRIYGDKNKFRIIYDANRDVLSNPNRIYAGLVLKIPTQY